MKDAEGLLTSGTAIDSDLLDHAPKLKVVSNNSVGYDNFNIEEMKRRGVVGTHTPYTLDDTVADLAFSLILSSARRVAEWIDSSAPANGEPLRKNLFSVWMSTIRH